MKPDERIRALLERLLADGEAVIATRYAVGGYIAPQPSRVSLREFAEWRASGRLLVSLLGDYGAPWQATLLKDEENTISAALMTQGTFQSIKHALDEGLLVRYDDLVFAEAFAHLLDQAEYLLDQGFSIASGVLLRAVLEERLNRLCSRNGVTVSKPRPTINDYNAALYKAQVYDKVTLKHVESMAAIGNEAAHATGAVSKTDIERLRRDVSEFLQRFVA